MSDGYKTPATLIPKPTHDSYLREPCSRSCSLAWRWSPLLRAASHRGLQICVCIFPGTNPVMFCVPQCSLSGSGARPRNWFAENSPKPTQGNKFSASSCRCLLLSAAGNRMFFPSGFSHVIAPRQLYLWGNLIWPMEVGSDVLGDLTRNHSRGLRHSGP